MPTGFQRAPFLRDSDRAFALLAIDTGVMRKIDVEQERWLDGALQRAAGKIDDGDSWGILFLPAATM